MGANYLFRVVKSYKWDMNNGPVKDKVLEEQMGNKSADKDMSAPIYRRSDRNTEFRFPFRLEGECSRAKEVAPRKSDLGRHPEDEQFGMSHPLVSRTESGR